MLLDSRGSACFVTSCWYIWYINVLTRMQPQPLLPLVDCFSVDFWKQQRVSHKFDHFFISRRGAYMHDYCFLILYSQLTHSNWGSHITSSIQYFISTGTLLWHPQFDGKNPISWIIFSPPVFNRGSAEPKGFVSTSQGLTGWPQRLDVGTTLTDSTDALSISYTMLIVLVL